MRARLRVSVLWALVCMALLAGSAFCQADSLLYEVVQTNPPLGIPPTPQQGFCSSNGGALGCANLQRYVRTGGNPGNSIVGNWLSAGADVAPLLASFFDSIFVEFRDNNTYTVRAVDPNGVSTFFEGTYSSSPSGVGNIYTIQLNQSVPSVATVEGIYEVLTTSTGIVHPEPAGGVRRYALYQNFPNPFNPTTQIQFDLPDASEVHLTVYNAAGQRVATLVDGNLTAGRHSVSFDAENLPAGVYLYRLKTGRFSATRKMLLVK